MEIIGAERSCVVTPTVPPAYPIVSKMNNTNSTSGRHCSELNTAVAQTPLCLLETGFMWGLNADQH
jgi:hypothetical protein